MIGISRTQSGGRSFYSPFTHSPLTGISLLKFLSSGDFLVRRGIEQAGQLGGIIGF